MSRDAYRLSANNLEELQQQLNFFLENIAGRLDQIEGFRGAAKIRAGLRVQDIDDDDALIHQFGNSE
jgi:hypothetical protein